MKKIFTLFFAVGMFAVVQAQPGSRDNRQPDQRDQNNGYDKQRDVVITNNPYDKNIRYDDRFSMERKRDMEIAKINREYDFKIQRVRNSFFLFRYEKERQIRLLEQQRQQELKMVWYKYPGKNDRYHDRDRDDRSNRRY